MCRDEPFPACANGKEELFLLGHGNDRRMPREIFKWIYIEVISYVTVQPITQETKGLRSRTTTFNKQTSVL
jgi:hypothetical protein